MLRYAGCPLEQKIQLINSDGKYLDIRLEDNIFVRFVLIADANLHTFNGTFQRLNTATLLIGTNIDEAEPRNVPLYIADMPFPFTLAR